MKNQSNDRLNRVKFTCGQTNSSFFILHSSFFCVPLHPLFEQLEHWRDGRVVDYNGLENRRTERYRGFESLSLRKNSNPCGLLFLWLRTGFSRFFALCQRRGFIVFSKTNAMQYCNTSLCRICLLVLYPAP